jgi:hypothetical protein
MGGTGIALPLLNPGTRMGWMVSTTFQSLSIHEIYKVSIVQGAVWKCVWWYKGNKAGMFIDKGFIFCDILCAYRFIVPGEAKDVGTCCYPECSRVYQGDCSGPCSCVLLWTKQMATTSNTSIDCPSLAVQSIPGNVVTMPSKRESSPFVTYIED